MINDVYFLDFFFFFCLLIRNDKCILFAPYGIFHFNSSLLLCDFLLNYENKPKGGHQSTVATLGFSADAIYLVGAFFLKKKYC